jgi:eukaryotic-like serine/threonine-protein kinase
MIATGTRLKERYRLERLLGRGGMASVWVATDEVLERPVAVKVLADTIASDPEFLARFRREARIAAGLSHPNLIGVYDYADGEERPYLVMEYVDGENLAERVAKGDSVEAERLARELLGALAHIHGAGILHRDVKPQNVLLAPDGSAKLIDFGIALPQDATALTRTGNLLGTARYVAPEAMSGRPASERSDLYSCGVVLRDCLGSRPPRELAGLVERLTSREPERRPASAREALAMLERPPVSTAEPTVEMRTAPSLAQTRSSPAPGRLDPPVARGRWGWVSAGLVALAGLAGVVFLLAAGSDEQLGGGPASDQRVERAPAGSRQDGSPQAAADGSAAEPTPSPDESAPAPESETAPTASTDGEDPALGSTLNEEGFGLIQEGRPEEAVPVLEEAVAAFPAGSEDLEYAYALFNLGNALRLSGRPDEAIPILEQRLAIPNQTDVVERELEAARSEAGG